MDSLSLAGLTENESRVYCALLELGPSIAGRISRKTGLHRRTIYDVTDTLVQKGVVGYIVENNRRLFRANDPNHLLTLIDERKQKLAPILEHLAPLYTKGHVKEQTLVFRGRNALKQVFESQLTEKEILILGANPKAYAVMPYFFRWYNERRRKKNVRLKVIAADRTIRPKGMVSIRYLPPLFQTPVALNIYGDNVAIILWSDDPVAIVISSKAISDSYRQYFDLMWGMAKQ
jgi:HTH-type transcriptional regulator, sugar sensing transcriptional regulator